NRSFEAMAKYIDSVMSVSGAAQPIRTKGAYVSADFFKVFRVQPIVGRDLRPEDAKKGAAPVVLVSYDYWKDYLGSQQDLSGSHLKIGNAVFTVIGVLPPEFQFPASASLWVAADLDGENQSRTSHNYLAVGRLRDGATAEQATAEISAIAQRIHNASSEKGD